jgi:hypothetical protein
MIVSAGTMNLFHPDKRSLGMVSSSGFEEFRKAKPPMSSN